MPGKALLAVHVFINVKDGCEEAFKVASTANATNSIKEEGISRFDFLQEKDNPNKFALVEVYWYVNTLHGHIIYPVSFFCGSILVFRSDHGIVAFTICDYVCVETARTRVRPSTRTPPTMQHGRTLWPI